MAVTDLAQVLNDLAEEIGNTAESKGFWDPEDVGDIGIIPLKLALIASEVSESLDVHRTAYDDSEEDGVTRLTEMQQDDLMEEIADILIRAFDLAQYVGDDIGEVIIDKMEKNSGRPYRHGKRY